MHMLSSVITTACGHAMTWQLSDDASASPRRGDPCGRPISSPCMARRAAARAAPTRDHAYSFPILEILFENNGCLFCGIMV